MCEVNERISYLTITYGLRELKRKNCKLGSCYCIVKTTSKCSKHESRNYRLNRNGNFCKGTHVGKIIAGAKFNAHVVQQKSSVYNFLQYYQLKTGLNVISWISQTFTKWCTSRISFLLRYCYWMSKQVKQSFKKQRVLQYRAIILYVVCYMVYIDCVDKRRLSTFYHRQPNKINRSHLCWTSQLRANSCFPKNC